MAARTASIPVRAPALPREGPTNQREGGSESRTRVRIDQDLCTGDGLCVAYAAEVFEFDIDGLAYVKGADGAMRTEPGAEVGVPERLHLAVIDAARECPGDCIHVSDTDGRPIAGPDAD